MHYPIDHSETPIRLFKSDFLEFFTHISPITVIVIWLPFAVYMFVRGFLESPAGISLAFIPVAFLIGLFLWLTRRIMHIGRQAIALDRVFAGLVAQGVGIWMGFQAFINMGVNLGALPTKGLTLPLMSFGGSAILINLAAIAIVLRIDYENRQLMQGGRV